MYLITASSDFEELWRYNIFATCEGFDSSGESLYVVGSESITSEEVQRGIPVAPVLPPEGFSADSVTVELECGSADRIEAVVYIVPHTLPEDRVVDNSPPFDLYVLVEQDGATIYHNTYKVNQWGGESVNINIKL